MNTSRKGTIREVDVASRCSGRLPGLYPSGRLFRRFALWAALLALLLSSRSGWASCPSTSEELATVIGQAIAAFQARKPDLVARQEERIRYLVECLGEPIDPAVAAAYYRVEGLTAFLGRDAERATAFFHYAQIIDPSYVFPEELIPPGHDVRRYYAEARGRPPYGTIQEELPRGMKMYIDGRHTELRPTERPVLMQLVSNNGMVEWSGLLRENSDLPFAVVTHRRHRTARHLFLTAGGVGVLSAGLWTAAGVSVVRMNRFAAAVESGDDTGTDWSSTTEAISGFNRANLWGWSAQVGTGVCAGLALSGMVVLKW